MPNSNLTEAKRAKNDEFYTQYADIEKEITAYLEFNPDVFRGKTLSMTYRELSGNLTICGFRQAIYGGGVSYFLVS